MKNKPVRHKESNTFKFKPFAERISDIDIDIFHRVGHEYENETDEEQCYFYQAVENWSILNLTQGFDEFKSDIKANTLITLPQLILQKDHVVEVLLKHLKLKNPLCLQPILNIVVAVAKDLRKEFYPYYKEFLSVLIDLLNTRDTEQLEWIFTCLAYLFKFLWRPLIKDIVTVFNTLLPLLSNTKPEYINNFAAESFAFVARKIKDYPAFLCHILKTVESKKDGVEGCGKLFFEVIHGVDGQFHSCTENILPFLLESLLDSKYPQTVLFEILEQVIASISQKITPHHTGVLWSALLKVLKTVEDSWKKDESVEIAGNIELILKLIGQTVEYKSGKLLQDPNVLVQQIIKFLDNNKNLPDSVLLTVIQIVILLLLSKNVRLTQEQASGLTRKVLGLPQQSVLLYFVDNVSSFSSFEPYILPTFLRQCLNNDLSSEYFTVLTNLILKKSPLAGTGLNLSNWKRYPIDFIGRPNNLKIENLLLTYITDMDHNQITNYMKSLICLPHLSISHPDNILHQLTINCKKLIASISDIEKSDNKSDLKRLLFLLNNTVECIIHIDGVRFCGEHFDIFLDSLLPTVQNVNCISALRTIDMLITVLKDDEKFINMGVLKRFNERLQDNFSSPHHEIRLITLHIYTFFEDLPDFDLEHSSDPDVPKEKWQVFTLCFRTESVDPQVHTYRDQIKNLEKLNFDKCQMSMCNQTQFKTLPLRYLCGVLYMNFKLLWDPVINIITTHAQGLDINSFWDVYGEGLKRAGERIRNKSIADVDIMISDCASVGDLYQNSQKLDAKVDFVNYRVLLWKAMGLFPEVAEAKTRDVSELLLNFIENEYTRSYSDIAMTCNIKQNSPLNANEETPADATHDESTADKTEGSVPQKNGKATMQTLLNMLAVFSKVRSPKSMYREPELNKFYFDLLQHKSQDVQKLAFDCIMTYKHKYLVPYKENLYRLINDKTFKNELVVFHIDKDSDLIQREHRENLIPFVLRIVFSKMGTKAKLRTGGKSSSHLRRNLVFRFLAGCEEQDVLTFIKMSFRNYTKYFDEDPEIMVDNVSEAVDLEHFVHLKALQSTINMLNVILDQFGGLMGNDVLALLVQIILATGATIKGAFQQISSVHAGYFAVLKTLRTLSTTLVERFFDKFDRYPWNNKQINAVFKVFVWPYLDKLDIESIHSPTALLKLFVQWGSNPRYFSLLAKHDGTETRYALPQVIKLLLNPKSTIVVINAIQEMIEKMLKLEADEEDQELAIPVDDLLPIQKDILDRVSSHDKLNYGSCILLPHGFSILEKIQRKLEVKNKNLNFTELFILSRISELIWESDISDKTLKLLLPIVLKKCNSQESEDVLIKFLTTVHNLIGNVTKPDMHLRQIAPLFGVVVAAPGRKLLSETLKVLSLKSNQEILQKGSVLIDELNAWDPKWVDQPDFQRRLDAFKNVNQAIENDEIELQVATLVMYNCYFTLKHEKDRSLRENSTHCLKRLSNCLINKYKKSKDFEYIINEIVLNSIRAGMKSKNEDFRNECISWLGYLARECPDCHPVLRDLNKYTHKTDPELDCFENLVQLQAHGHTKALMKFTKVTSELTSSPNIRTLTQFLLPFASFYLCTERYSNKTSLIDSAINFIGVVCKILPWHQYEGLLKFYLGELRKKLDYQKQLVKVTVVILDGFHFDLSKGQILSDTLAKSAINEEIRPSQDNQEQNVPDNQDSSKNDDLATGSLIEESEENQDLPATETDATEENNDAENQDQLQIDEVLDQELSENETDEEDDQDDIVVEGVKICEKTTILCKSTSTRVIKTIQLVLLPQLHKTLAEMTHYDTSHKVNRKKKGFEREEADLLRVPISLALVKLLQRLPKEILEFNLPGIFMKMCSFLKSPLESVRRITRETLQKMMQTLGPEYLNLLLKEMTTLLNRGFQVHVLVFTSHAVLNCLRDAYKPADIDKVLLTVLDLCRVDLFGSSSEEKEVLKIAAKTSEAKSTKSYDMFQILARFITDKCLMDLVLPIRNVLQTSHSYKIIQKAEESLRHIALGLADNTFISVESLLKFSYGTASESIPVLMPNRNKNRNAAKEKQKLLVEKTDSFIIPNAPVLRYGMRQTNVKTLAATNAHVLVEFGLRLCYILLKRDKANDEQYKPFLDPFVPIFKNCLLSKHVKLCTITLQCVSWVMKYELPSMKDHIGDIAKTMFAILHKYASAGLSKGDNFDLVVASFKAMAVLVRDVKYHTINTDQLKMLLLYAEQDMYDHDRHATAFNLLKAIVARKFIIPEIHQVMDKVAELSITSELNYVRTQSRMVFYHYLMDYPLGDKLEKHVAFYLSQMDYELQYGRESAIEMIQTLVNSFPVKVVKEHSGMFLVRLGARLVNEEVPECRKAIAECLSSMLEKLEKADRDPLFDIILLWFKDNNLSHRQLAAQLCGIFILVEKSSFETRLPKLMPLVLKQFGITKAKSKSAEKGSRELSDETERIKDHYLFQTLQMLLKLCAQCPSFLKADYIKNLAQHVQTLLAYPHDWVRLAAAQFIGCVLFTIDVEHLATLLVSTDTNGNEDQYLCNDPVNSIKSLTLDLCDQLQPDNIKGDLAEQVVKNLVFVARVLQKVPAQEGAEQKINLLWLVKRIRKIVHTEVVQTPTSTVLRTEVFKWVAGVTTVLEGDSLLLILHHLLAPLVREMITTEESNAPLRQLAKKVAKSLKHKVGIDLYSRTVSKLEQTLTVKRADRKRSRTQLAVTDPEVYAKKKIKRHEKKKESKKRKIVERKGGKMNFKKRKVEADDAF